MFEEMFRGKQHGYYQPQNKERKEVKPAVFRVEHEEFEGECALCPKPVVLLSSLVLDKIDALMEEYQSKEWLAYLLGHGLEVEDLVIPKQEVSYASVQVNSYPESTRIIGVVHSHGNFGLFHSSVDNEYLVGNHNVSVIVSKSGMTAKVRTITPCQKLLIQDADVERRKSKTDGFITYAKQQIQDRAITTTSFPPNYGGYG